MLANRVLACQDKKLMRAAVEKLLVPDLRTICKDFKKEEKGKKKAELVDGIFGQTYDEIHDEAAARRAGMVGGGGESSARRAEGGESSAQQAEEREARLRRADNEAIFRLQRARLAKRIPKEYLKLLMKTANFAINPTQFFQGEGGGGMGVG